MWLLSGEMRRWNSRSGTQQRTGETAAQQIHERQFRTDHLVSATVAAADAAAEDDVAADDDDDANSPTHCTLFASLYIFQNLSSAKIEKVKTVSREWRDASQCVSVYWLIDFRFLFLAYFSGDFSRLGRVLQKASNWRTSRNCWSRIVQV